MWLLKERSEALVCAGQRQRPQVGLCRILLLEERSPGMGQEVGQVRESLAKGYRMGALKQAWL